MSLSHCQCPGQLVLCCCRVPDGSTNLFFAKGVLQLLHFVCDLLSAGLGMVALLCEVLSSCVAVHCFMQLSRELQVMLLPAILQRVAKLACVKVAGLDLSMSS